MPTENVFPSLKKIKNIIAVSSCKGGVGKSTVAAHVALELLHRKNTVGLIDADIHGPSIPALFNMQTQKIYSNENKLLIPAEFNGLKIMSFGFLLGDAPAVMRGPIVTRYIQQLLLSTDWGELDYLIIDMPPGTGDIQLTITQNVRLTGAIIVTTPQTLSLIDVARGIIMFEKVNVPILGVIENMSYFECGQCNAKHRIWGEESAHQLKERFGVATLSEIPLISDLAQSITSSEFNQDVFKEAVDALLLKVQNIDKADTETPRFEFDKKSVRFHWPDKTETIVSNKDLRLSCRCALCANELTGEQIYKEEHVIENIMAKEITPLGNYAVSIEWNDGHASGIFPYDNIKKVSKNIYS